MKLKDVLDQIKEKYQISANAELGRLLDIDKRRIGEYYNGREPMADDYPKIAMASGRRVDELQAVVKLDIETDEKSREVWSRYYKSIGGLAASFAAVICAILLSVTLIVTSTPAKASDTNVCKPAYFVLCNLLHIFNRIAAFVRGTFSASFPRFCFSG